MPRTKATIGFGTVLEIALASAPGVWVYIAETTSHEPPSFTDATVEATHMQSPGGHREFIPGLTDPGQSSHEMNFEPGSATDVFLLSIRGKNLIARLTFPNGRQMVYNCVREGYERAIPLDERLTATLTLKVSGEPTLTAVAAPRNLVAPVITGTAKVGHPLTVDEGVWAGAMSLTYQWQNEGVDIAGQTGRTYVPVDGDIGDGITCEITGVNGSFSTEVETPVTDDVIA